MNTQSKLHYALLASVAVNIFMGAFVLGKLSAPVPMPPPPPLPFEMGENMPPSSEGIPSGARDGERRHPTKKWRDDFRPPHGEYMPPPLFAPADLFSPEEMQEGFAKMRNTFKQVRALRKDFAEKLKQGEVTTQQVRDHFVQVEQMMNAAKQEMQEKAAEKISAMTPQQRQEFAEKMLKKGRRGERGMP